MNENAVSLDRLHDLALPPPVPWWPPAPGWYVVAAVVLVLVVVLVHRAWKNWRANAYRREALRELRSAESAAAIARLLRRTALAVVPRPVVATKSGAAWLDWLSAHGPDPMPENVRAQLGAGLYDPHFESRDLTVLRDYAARWISRHRLSGETSTDVPC